MIPRWVILTSALVALSTCAPTAWRAATTPPEMYFTGNWEYVHDQSTYLMWAAQVAEGNVLVYDLHTSEPHPPLLPPLPWLIVGLVTRFTHLPLLWAYHGLRLIAGFAYLLLAWLVVTEYFRATADGERDTALQEQHRRGRAEENVVHRSVGRPPVGRRSLRTTTTFGAAQDRALQNGIGGAGWRRMSLVVL